MFEVGDRVVASESNKYRWPGLALYLYQAPGTVIERLVDEGYIPQYRVKWDNGTPISPILQEFEEDLEYLYILDPFDGELSFEV